MNTFQDESLLIRVILAYVQVPFETNHVEDSFDFYGLSFYLECVRVLQGN